MPKGRLIEGSGSEDMSKDDMTGTLARAWDVKAFGKEGLLARRSPSSRGVGVGVGEKERKKLSSQLVTGGREKRRMKERR